MVRWIMHFFVDGLALILVSKIVNGITIDGYLSALLAAVVLSILNTLIKPVLIILTLPVTILTFGLFSLVINAVIFMLAGFLLNGFAVSGFFPALIGSILLAIISSLLNSILK